MYTVTYPGLDIWEICYRKNPRGHIEVYSSLPAWLNPVFLIPAGWSLSETFWHLKKSLNFQLKWSLNSKWGQCKLIRWLTLKLPPFAHVNNLELYCPVGCAGSHTSLSKPKRMADSVRDIKLLISTEQIKTIVLSFLTCYLTIFGHWN